MEKKSYSNREITVLKAYCEITKKTRMHPTRVELLKRGHNRDKIRDLFGNLEGLREAAKDWKPEIFDGIIDESIFTPKKFARLKDDVKDYKRFVITTAVTGCKIHEGFLKSIQTYCEKNDAKLLVLPCTDPASAGTGSEWSIPSLVGEGNVVMSDLSLNSNVFISSIKLSAKQIDPTTGLARIGQRNGSFIYASPKQRLKFVPVSNTKYPHAEMTTGAITLPNYTPRNDKPHWYMSRRTAYIAHNDHVMGAIILEIQDEKRFHFRQIQAESSGSFVDLGNYYQGRRVSRLNAEALVMGDWHSGETDPTAKKAWKEVVAVARPKKLFVHDGFNGKSINPHEIKKQITQAQSASTGLLQLEPELRGFAKDLDELATWPGIEEVLVVYSNHDAFLERWLEDGTFGKDPVNYRIGTELAAAMFDGKYALQYGVEKFGLKHKNKVRWLGVDEDYKIARIQLGAHGHIGPKGSRGNIRNMESSYGQSVTGHAHGPEIMRGAWQMGTSSFLKLNYNKGPSDWVHSSCLVYSNGARQLINSFGGDWHS